jgi:tetratricopeptide (TPR) repeat protein
MNTSESHHPGKKTCTNPRCRKIDETDFSTCRHCGHKYSDLMQWSAPDNKAAEIGAFLRDPMQVLLALLVCGGLYFAFTKRNPENILGDTVSDVLTTGEKRENRRISHETKVLEKYPHDVDARIRRGDAYQEILNSRAALADYNAAIELSPRAEYFKKRALAYDALGEYKRAEADRVEAHRLEHR